MITVSGSPTEAKNNQWEYYVNMIHEMDQFVEDLITAVDSTGEDSVIVFYGDHLPTMDLTEEDVRSALKLSNNDRAPGVNGIRYEFFKILDIEYKKFKDKPGAFNIMGFLADLYRDIEQFGIADGCNFSHWMVMSRIQKRRHRSH